MKDGLSQHSSPCAILCRFIINRLTFMDALNQITSTVAMTMGLAWASGINLYATLLTLGFLANSGNINLPPDLQIVANPAVMMASLGSTARRNADVVEVRLP